ncbi:uncharacterized protein LOC111083953 isoform X2 [Limulus polyphemus]|uniref:Uncharacterized protein LOC111083953 isoform X2 n=1 Tax=Limulus polyphemus TaxID=6850 RepID=A0ABM1RYG3_LIMPO|nr:uncharacterized protein LOC111083953 isoform X2 [Limulus polyphemus]
MRKTSKCRTESISVFSSVAAERLADYRGGTDASPSVSLKDIDGTITGSMSGCITGGQETDPSPSSSHHDQPTSRETSKESSPEILGSIPSNHICLSNVLGRGHSTKLGLPSCKSPIVPDFSDTL